MADSTPRARATINLSALHHNLAQVRQRCPDAQIFPVIKANAYGHGVEPVARSIRHAPTSVSGVAVATIDEALTLESMKLDLAILLLPGFINAEELAVCLNAGIEPVLHSTYQIDILRHMLKEDFISDSHRFWLKVNTGMNRLGLDVEEARQVFSELRRHPDVELVLMSHLACADEKQPSTNTESQIALFSQLQQELSSNSERVNASLAASAGILAWPETLHDIVRPGIMLYGSSPLHDHNAEELNLRPVMTLRSRIIAINAVKAGQAIGYGATYVSEKDTHVGVISVGYADGYPRSARNGTPVLVQCADGARKFPLVGRVSMDMITVDLGDSAAAVGDEVILWGEGLACDIVAQHADTIAYELFCKVTARVPFDYIDKETA